MYPCITGGGTGFCQVGHLPTDFIQRALDAVPLAGKLAQIRKTEKFLLPFLLQVVQLLFEPLTVTTQQPGSGNKLFGERITGETLDRVYDVRGQTQRFNSSSQTLTHPSTATNTRCLLAGRSDLDAVNIAAIVIIDVGMHTNQLTIAAQVLNICRQQPGVDILLLDLAALQAVIALVLAYHMQDVGVHILPGLFGFDPNQRLDTHNTKFHK